MNRSTNPQTGAIRISYQSIVGRCNKPENGSTCSVPLHLNLRKCFLPTFHTRVLIQENLISLLLAQDLRNNALNHEAHGLMLQVNVCFPFSDTLKSNNGPRTVNIFKNCEYYNSLRNPCKLKYFFYCTFFFSCNLCSSTFDHHQKTVTVICVAWKLVSNP